MAETNKISTRPDLATIAGVCLALGGIIGGLVLEGGKVAHILNGTAALIVLGGTFGAVLISMPLGLVLGAVKQLKSILLENSQPLSAAIEEIIAYAVKARKNGLVSLEQEADLIADPFLRKALILAVDGTDIQEIRKMLELDIELEEHRREAEAKVFESAGGYAPTIGIIGAVLGLIQVMQDLADVSKVGTGIAGAFVATVYGVGIANILLLPAATKIKCRMQHQVQMRELILEGVVAIVEGLNPKLIRAKLESYASGEAAVNNRGRGRASEAMSPAGA